jgi:hypothetical protein
MMKVVKKATKDPYLKYIAEKLTTDPQKLKKIFRFAFHSAKYQPDDPDLQTIRTPKRTLRDGQANCVDYSVLTSSLLSILKIPHSFRVVSFDGTDNFSHIYTVTDNGYILDCVIGQDQLGNEHLKTKRRGHFNKEVPYTNGKDFRVI